MPNRNCFVPYCRSSYTYGEEKKISMFRVPNDKTLFELWQKNINRSDRTLSKRDVVCEKHFVPEDIIRYWKSGNVSIIYYNS